MSRASLRTSSLRVDARCFLSSVDGAVAVGEPDERVDVDGVDLLVGELAAELVGERVAQLLRVGEAERLERARADVLRPVDEDALVVGDVGRGLALELGVLGGGVGDQLLGLSTSSAAFALRPTALPVISGLLLPAGAVVDLALGLGDDRGDLGERVVLLLGHAGVDGEDQVRALGGDLLDLQAVGVGQDGRRPSRCRARPSPTGRSRRGACRTTRSWPRERRPARAARPARAGRRRRRASGSDSIVVEPYLCVDGDREGARVGRPRPARRWRRCSSESSEPQAREAETRTSDEQDQE